jgi:hypothetical protein
MAPSLSEKESQMQGLGGGMGNLKMSKAIR